MDVSKLVSYEVTSNSHEVLEDGIVTNVFLEVSIVHEDDPKKPQVWGHYLGDKDTARYQNGEDQDVILESVIRAFNVKDQELTKAQAISEAVPLTTKAKISIKAGSTDVVDFVASREKRIADLQARIEDGRLAEEELRAIRQI